MEAGLYSRRTFCVLAMVACSIGLLANSSQAASFRTQNFIIKAPTQQLASAVGEAAETYRRDLAVHWLGKPLPNWPNPCPVIVIAGPNLAAQGVTTYNPRPVRDFQMEVVGTPERILDSVLPHEVTHTILATHFGRPIPRWADEGVCTTVEHTAERSKHEAKLREFLGSRRGIAMNQLFLLTEYPSDVLPMYAQGYSVCRFLIEQKGPRQFIQFLGDYMQHPSWTANIKKHYNYDSLAELQNYWLEWVKMGSGPVASFAKIDRNPASGTVAQASATAPINNFAVKGAPMRLNAPAQAETPIAPETRLARTNELRGEIGTWYQRRRQEGPAATEGPASASLTPPVTPIIPPSVRDSGRYRSAQPQPEQRISRDPNWGYDSRFQR